METFARNSLAQFMTIYSEVVSEAAEMLDTASLERLMWAKISGGSARATNRIPWVIAKKIKVQLPYLPSLISYTGCQGLKKCDGLYVPCGGKCTEESILCVTCEKHGAKFGVLEDRGEPGSYTDPMDKREITYGTWLQKHEKTIEEVNAAIQEAGFDFEIPASYLAVNARRVVVKKAGRPKTKMTVSESDDESDDASVSSNEEKPKKKAAPKKAATSDDEEKPKKKAAPKKAETSDDEDKPKKKAAPKAKKAETSDDEEKPKKKAAPKAKKAETSDDEEPKKADSSDDEEKPKKKAAPKPKAKKAETSDDEEPKKKAAPKPKAKKASDDESEPKKATKAKKEEEKPKTTLADVVDSELSAMSNTLAADDYDEEDEEDELIMHDGVEYTLRGKSLFNEDGEFVGTMVNGSPVFR
jgi:hypothetical protein